MTYLKVINNKVYLYQDTKRIREVEKVEDLDSSSFSHFEVVYHYRIKPNNFEVEEFYTIDDVNKRLKELYKNRRYYNIDVLKVFNEDQTLWMNLERGELL